MLIDGEGLVAGMAQGSLLLLSEPLSLWGGVDLATGRIVDRSHPEIGESISGRILAMRSGRGSSSSSSALAEMARAGHAPAGILLGRTDPVLIIGALVCADLYGIALPVGLVPDQAWQDLCNAARISISSRPPTLSVSLG